MGGCTRRNAGTVAEMAAMAMPIPMDRVMAEVGEVAEMEVEATDVVASKETNA